MVKSKKKSKKKNQIPSGQSMLVLDHMLKNNSKKYNLLKAAEELQELALVLTQKVLKPEKTTDQMVTDEIGDVIIRVQLLQRIFDPVAVRKRFTDKMEQYRVYINEECFKNI
jgi:NTP pyrophosphatase (non-canonical NTP hydrolase)